MIFCHESIEYFAHVTNNIVPTNTKENIFTVFNIPKQQNIEYMRWRKEETRIDIQILCLSSSFKVMVKVTNTNENIFTVRNLNIIIYAKKNFF